MRKIVRQREYLNNEGDPLANIMIVEHRHNPGQIESLIIEFGEGGEIEIDLHMARTYGWIDSPQEAHAKLAATP